MTDEVREQQLPAKAPRTKVADTDKSWHEKHHKIVVSEIAALNTRRETSRPVEVPESGKVLDVVGLALSGGGIRSSAICLGVLQALNHHDLIGRIDYLSTVSGGGYIGSSLTATMTCAKEFVFGKTPAGAVLQRAGEISDTPAVGHLRNYSNYLIPAGARDLLTAMAIVVRGLVANLSLTLPLVLLLAAVTIWSTPLRTCLSVANLFGIGLGEKDKAQCELHHFALVDGYKFSVIGAAIALLLFVVGAIVYWRSHSVRGTGPSTVFAYLAGIALLLGIACDFARLLDVKNFALTLATALLGLALFFIWALKQSLAGPAHRQEFRGQWPTIGATYLVLLALVAFFEFQPFMLAQMFDAVDGGVAGGPIGGLPISWIKSLAAITAPIAGLVTVFRQQFAELVKGNTASSELGSLARSVIAKAAIWIAGAALPLIIWVGYLYLCYWGIANDIAAKCPPPSPSVVQNSCAVADGRNSAASKNLTGKIQLDSGAGTLSAEIAQTGTAAPHLETPTLTSHAPAWLASPAKYIAERAGWSDSGFGYAFALPIVILYAFAALMLFGLSWFLTPNANSLHRLYRDRLSKAFLFDPRQPAEAEVGRVEASLDQGRDFQPLDRMKLSDLYPPDARKLNAPYHLINTALNIQGSDFANRRGRNADFFVFSPLHVGSEATRYAETPTMEGIEPSLDLATAMAISGAAASSNMGSSSIKPLTPTLALLNVRLGYWLKNPRYVDASSKPQRRSTPLYLWSEISGRLYENSDGVYLTDGGHIENLGLYELLRRRCKVIIAVDAEADAPMNFSALMTLQRYARIDLGIRIVLPWTSIQSRTLELMNGNAGKPASPAPAAPVDPCGPHVAIGIIDYGGGEKGYLVYIKSSLSGDENDYIRDYARRNHTFPHETTGDQFFSEEQFEVYRALGFHMTHGFLSGDHVVVAATDTEPRTTKFTAAGVASIDAVRLAFGLPVARPAEPSGDMASL
jgi:hypothetical protein